LNRCRAYEVAFADVKLLPPKVKYANEHPGSPIGTPQEIETFRSLGIPIPGEDMSDRWLISWRVGEKQPSVELRWVRVSSIEAQGAVADKSPGFGKAVAAVKAWTGHDVFVATRSRFLAVRGLGVTPSIKGLARALGSRGSRNEAAVVSIPYAEIDSTHVDASNLYIRSRSGPIVHVHWKPPGSNFRQVVFALGSAFAEDGDRVANTMLAESHGRMLAERRGEFWGLMSSLADDAQAVARVF